MITGKTEGQTFHFFALLSALPLPPDRSLFLLADVLAIGAAPRITESTDNLFKDFKVFIFRLGPNKVLSVENEF